MRGREGGLCSSPGESKAQTVSGRQRARKKDKKKRKRLKAACRDKNENKERTIKGSSS